MNYPDIPLAPHDVPRAAEPLLQHVLDIYAGETNKTASVWNQFADGDLGYRPHPRSSTAGEVMSHQLLSERRFFAEFLGLPEPPANAVLPADKAVPAFSARLVELARPRLNFLAAQSNSWWLETTRFFDVNRERIWIFWRRVLHSAHHRTQLSVYLRLLNKPVVPVYGPTADVTWEGADPTLKAGR